MFDELGSPWQIHSCWEELRNVEYTTIERAFRKALNDPPAKRNPPERKQTTQFKPATEAPQTPTPVAEAPKPEKKKWRWWHFLIAYLVIKAILIVATKTNGI